MATVQIAPANAVQNAENQQPAERLDEVQQYLEGRYISASEAAWRLLGFRLFAIYPSVERLPVHNANQQYVTFRADQPPQQIRENLQTETKLTAWFTLNQRDEAARTLTYSEIPEHYAWDARGKRWKARQRGGDCHIGRMVFLSPAAGDTYFLRLLLTQVPGCRSFEDVRTFEGITHPTFKSACIARGLLQDDAEPRACLREAAQSQLPVKLRQLFVLLLVHSTVADPAALWHEFKSDLSDDFRHRLAQQQPDFELDFLRQQAYNLAINDIADKIKQHGRKLEDFHGLPIPENQPLGRVNRLILAQRNYDPLAMQRQLNESVPRLNIEQRRFYDAVVHCMGNNGNENGNNVFFLDGPGGTGKTFVWNTILSKCRSEGKIALAVASSAVAAALIEGGRTAHSQFKIPVDGINEASTCNFTANSDLAELIRQTDLIIWDECPMVHKFSVMAVERTLRDIMGAIDAANRDKLFGGKIVLLGGDFRQALPVVPRASRAQCVDASISRTAFWNSVRKFKLTENMRVRRAQGELGRDMLQFSNWLLDIGNGLIQRIPVHEAMKCNTVSQLITDIFPEDILSRERVPIDRAILAPLNSVADDVNAEVLLRMPGDEFIFLSRDTIIEDENPPQHRRRRFNPPTYPAEFLNSQEPPGCSPHRLVLKRGCPVILLRNLDVEKGLCNGTRLWVRQCSRTVIQAEIATGRCAGDVVFIPRIPINVTHPNIPFKFCRMQFPLKPAFAMTINKSQGQTLGKVGICLRSQVFSHGQLYVALSRATSPADIKIFSGDDGNQPLINMVFEEALR